MRIEGVLAGLCWLLGFVFLWRVPRCRLTPGHRQYPRISVIIPARNEETNLAQLLPSLTRQDLKPHEILVVDDHSQDATGSVARSLGARVFLAPELPPGWLGKPWACQQGAEAATGEFLLFLDADTRLEPGGLRKMMDTCLRSPGVLSVSPYHQTQTWSEQFSAFFNLMQLGGLNAFTLWGKRLKPAGLFGPCMLVKKTDYQRAGGHAAVKNQLLENYSLARPLAGLGVLPQLYGGQGALSVRLYPEGLAALTQGWGKSFAKGAGQTPPAILAVSIIWIAGMILVTIFLTRALALRQWGASLGWLLAYAAYAGQTVWQLHQAGKFKIGTALFFPIPLIFFLVVFTWSTFLLSVRKQVSWKGRIINEDK